MTNAEQAALEYSQGKITKEEYYKVIAQVFEELLQANQDVLIRLKNH